MWFSCLTLPLCGYLEWLHDVMAHPRKDEGLHKRRSEPIRPFQSNRGREAIARASPLGNEFVDKRRVVMSLELDEVDLRGRDVSQDIHGDRLDVIDLDNSRVPFSSHDARASNRRGKKAMPIVRIVI